MSDLDDLISKLWDQTILENVLSETNFEPSPLLEKSLSEAGFKDSPFGKQLEELQKLRQGFEQYYADYAAYKAAEEHRAKIAEKKGFWRGIITGTIGSTIAGLIVLAVQNWPFIVSFFCNL